MSNSISIMQGDTKPDHTALLSDEIGPVVLTGATVVLWMKHKTSGTVVGPLACTVDAAAGVGRIRRAWGAGDTSVPGVYLVEYVVTLGTGGQETFPSDGGATLTIKARRTT